MVQVMIRSARPADAPAVQSLLLETWHATYDAIYGAARVDELTTRWHALPNLALQSTAPGTLFLVAEVDGTLAGTSLAEIRDGRTMLIARLYVHPVWQGQGFGRSLMQHMLGSFPDARLAELEVENQNEAAIGFYEAMGFSLQRALRFDGREDTPNTLKMAKVLGQTFSAAS